MELYMQCCIWHNIARSTLYGEQLSTHLGWWQQLLMGLIFWTEQVIWLCIWLLFVRNKVLFIFVISVHGYWRKYVYECSYILLLIFITYYLWFIKSCTGIHAHRTFHLCPVTLSIVCLYQYGLWWEVLWFYVVACWGLTLCYLLVGKVKAKLTSTFHDLLGVGEL